MNSIIIIYLQNNKTVGHSQKRQYYKIWDLLRLWLYLFCKEQQLFTNKFPTTLYSLKHVNTSFKGIYNPNIEEILVATFLTVWH